MMVDFRNDINTLDLSHNKSDFYEIELKDGGYRINARMDLYKRSDTLLVTFHGNANQRRAASYPVLQTKRLSKTLKLNVLSIADPTVQHDKSLTIGWYVGFHDFSVQKVLVEFIRKCAARYGSEKIIFMGGSGGGFAALFFSWHFRSSVALAVNPQTVLFKEDPHFPRADKFRTVITKNFHGNHDGLCLDLCDLYKNGFDNFVIYIQNGQSIEDIRYHVSPFLDACMHSSPDGLLIKMDYWGIRGHAGSIPASEYHKWVNAIQSAENINVSDLYSHYFEATQNTIADSGNKKSMDQRYLQISEIIGNLE